MDRTENSAIMQYLHQNGDTLYVTLIQWAKELLFIEEIFQSMSSSKDDPLSLYLPLIKLLHFK